MIKAILIITLLSPSLWAFEAPVDNKKTLEIRIISQEEFKTKLLVGTEVLESTKDSIKRKALIDGIQISLEENFKGYQKEIVVSITPSVDQKEDVAKFQSFLKNLED